MHEPIRVKVFVQIDDGNVVRFGNGLVATPENITSGTVTLLRETADLLELTIKKDQDVLKAIEDQQ